MFLFYQILGEYKDVWDVDRKWTASGKLKANFKKIRKEIDMNNQVVEEFLQEAILMTRFNHPNIMPLFGVSVHNDKPSVILPLMVNGDLKTYLKRNHVSMTLIMT